MSQYSIDPDLRDRRLVTLVRLLEWESRTSTITRKGELTSHEMVEWARQIRNLNGTADNAPIKTRKVTPKPLETLSDEELLS